MTLKENEEKNKFLCQKFGKHWYGILEHDLNPDYCSEQGRIELLREMEKIDKSLHEDNRFIHEDFPIWLITEEGGTRLVDAAIEFFKEQDK